MIPLLYLVFGFILGSIPIGYLAAKAKGIDITKEGSGNIGATNVVRVLGKGWGLTVFLLDVLKGFIPAYLARTMVFQAGGPDAVYATEWGFAAGFCAILGHSFSPFLKFKGGKGIATGLGMMLGAAPLAGMAGFAVFNLVLAATLIVSISSCFAALSLCVFAFLFGEKIGVVIALFALGIYIVVKHKANLQRLIDKTEPRIGQKPGEPPPNATKPRIVALLVAFALIAGVVIGLQAR